MNIFLRFLGHSLVLASVLGITGCEGDSPATTSKGATNAGFSMKGAVVKSRRTSGGPVESYFPILATEHYDTGSQFAFALTGTTGAVPANLRFEIWDLDGGDDLVESGEGKSTWLYVFNGDRNAEELGCTLIWYYVDKNNNDDWSWGEDGIETPYFYVMDKKVYNIKTEVSSQLSWVKNDKIQNKMIAGQDLLLKKDSAEDFRACVDFKITFLPSFTAGPARPDPILSGDKTEVVAKLKKHWDAPSDIVWIERIDQYWSESGKLINPVGVCSEKDWHQIIIEWHSDRSKDAPEVAHEFGHGVGLDHPAWSGADKDIPKPLVRVMFEVLCEDQNKLSRTEARAFDGGD